MKIGDVVIIKRFSGKKQRRGCIIAVGHPGGRHAGQVRVKWGFGRSRWMRKERVTLVSAIDRLGDLV
jgi:hypothetical protein